MSSRVYALVLLLLASSIGLVAGGSLLLVNTGNAAASIPVAFGVASFLVGAALASFKL